MSSAAVGLLVSVFVFFGAVGGIWLSRILPDEHLSKETQDVIKLSTGMLSVLASLVLGLLIASAKSSYDHIDADVRQFSSQVIQLGDTLRGMGKEAAPTLVLLRDYTMRSVQTHNGGIEEPADVEDGIAANLLIRLRDAIIDLPSNTPRQTMLRAQAWELFEAVQRSRWRIVQEAPNSFQPAVLVILVVWISLIFASFGLNAPRNLTVVVALLICSAAIGCAIFLVHEMDAPFDGLIQIPGEPMQKALGHLSL